MMAGKCFFALAVLLCISVGRAAVIGAGVLNPANGHTYFLIDPKTWTASEAEAVTLGGHLVTINNAAENQFLIDTFTSGANLRRVLWIGLTDAGTEGQFRWISGEPVTYTNWFSGEPNNNDGRGGPENYANFNWHMSFPDSLPNTPRGRWVDFRNDGVGGPTRHPPPPGPFPGVVEVIPEPVSLTLMSLAGLGLLWSRRREIPVGP
jgi:Lectin C-type domain